MADAQVPNIGETVNVDIDDGTVVPAFSGQVTNVKYGWSVGTGLTDPDGDGWVTITVRPAATEG